ncbi:unnamed protein product [Polarella glacialis]|uniref:Uncharacterized protein n=1 Tax=Polarella glacialis TaxID=89957 RepID=A0A813DQR2_POLGL|nr:unnamed protein product [Polarella glacialis]
MPELIGPVFVADGPEQLLPEDRRLQAADPLLWQLVFMGETGLDISSFSERSEAESALAALKADQYGEGGGILVRAGDVIAENLFLKHMRQEDYVEYLQRATESVAPASAEVHDAAAMEEVVTTAKDRLRQLTKLAPEIAKLRAEYESKTLSEPQVIRGRPSEALIEFANLFPQYVRLGGCTRP